MAGHLSVSVEGPVLEVCFGEPGAEHHDMDALLPHFRPQALKQAVQGVFAGAVARPAKQRGISGMAGGYYDSPFSGYQAVYGCLGAVKGSEKVYGHNFMINSGIRMDKGTALGDPGIIDQDVNIPVKCNDGLYGQTTVLLAADITGEGRGLHPCRPKGLFLTADTLIVHINQSNLGPGATETFTNG
jgi:hypothetical protein